MKDKLKFCVLIPARYASTRFPGKPLAKLAGKEMILHVCQRVNSAVDSVAVATDDSRIADCVTDAGFKAVMTSSEHRSGTDRVWEAFNNLGIDADVIINVQGDEPFIDPLQIHQLMQCFNDNNDAQIATLARKFDKSNGFEALFDANVVKLTFSKAGDAMYFSRSIIPYVRGVDWKKWLDTTDFFTHVGIYAYRKEVLAQITSLPQSDLERNESLEQLRWLDNGYKIKVALTECDTIGIDTPEDLQAAEKYYNDNIGK